MEYLQQFVECLSIGLFLKIMQQEDGPAKEESLSPNFSFVRELREWRVH